MCITFPTRRLMLACAMTIAIASVGCDSDSEPAPPPPPPPAMGSLIVAIRTEGTPMDAASYSIQVAGREYHAGAFASLRVDSLVPGVHAVTLSQLAPNCTVIGDNPVSVTIDDGGFSEASFQVRCVENRVRIAVVTTGVDLDFNGYVLTTNTGTSRSLPTNGTITMRTEAPGHYDIVLSDVAPNCSPDPSNPASFTTVTDSVTDLVLAISCTRAPATVGSLHVMLTTNLEGSIMLTDARGSQRTALAQQGGNDLLIENLPPGAWRVSYSANSWGCTLNGSWYELPGSVTINAGFVTDLTLEVVCIIGGP